MKTSLSSFKKQYDELVLRFLWQQWSVLGVAGYAVTKDLRIVDPEALLLLSTVIARKDARLFDEILDWLQQNGSWINLQRLVRMKKEYELGEVTILAAIASHLCQNSIHAKWKVLTTKTGFVTSSDNARSLFPELPILGKADEGFRRWGWLRPPFKLRGLSQLPQPDQPAAFLMKLRSLFGRQSRAEILAWLLSHESGHPAEIARQIGYFRRSVQMILNEMILSGHIHSIKAAREKYFAVHHEEWRFLMTWKEADKFPRWIQWAPLFMILSRLSTLLDRCDFAAMSPNLQAIEITRAFDLPDFCKHAIGIDLALPLRIIEGELFDAVLKNIRSILD